MCSVSMVGDYWRDNTLPNSFPTIQPWEWKEVHTQAELAKLRIEVEDLRAQLVELKKLLLAAKAYDEALGEPHCETDEKVALIKKLAELVGVDMKEVFS